MRFIPFQLAALLLFGLATAPLMPAAAPIPPNVVLILADDLGWTDLGCFGSDLYRTPHIDRLAREGMKFTQAYSACTVCSPTRASLLTGKYPARLHVTDWIPGRPPANPKLLVPEWTKYLPLEETTLAEVFRAAGYATASIGKWHLGGEAYAPTLQGFDLNIAGTDAGSPLNGYFSPWRISTLRDGPPGEYLTDRMGAEAEKFIRANDTNPFFLYLPHFAVHTPIQAPPALVANYTARATTASRHTNATYAAMIESMDNAVGRVLAALKERRLLDRTIVVFTSDNGGHLPTTSNAPLRVGKGSCYEGGTRVPLIVRWLSTTPAGSTCDEPVITPDLYPTLLALTGVRDATDHRCDGVSLEPLLRQQGVFRRDALFWHYPHYQLYQQGGTVPYGAIRAGDFKLIEFFDGRPSELFDLRNDPGERHDLATGQPERVRSLHERLAAWRHEVGAQLPTPNPTYNPARAEHELTARQAKRTKKS